jgi:hypothetical protein
VHRRWGVAAAIALIVTACASPTPTTTPASQRPTDAPAASRTPTGPQPSSSQVPDPTRTAWDNATAGITRDGQVPLTTALQAFSVAYGVALPGVELPPGEAGYYGSGTGPVKWLLGHWDELTPEQQAAAAPYFDPNVPPPAATSNVPMAVAGGVPLPPAHPTNGATVEMFKQLAIDLQPQIAAKLHGRTLKLPFDVVFRNIPIDPEHPNNIVLASTVAIAADGEPFRKSSETEKSCLIQINTLGQQTEGEDQKALMAHELFHCFQYELAKRVGDVFYIPPWIDEGQGGWVGEDFTIGIEGSALGQRFWLGWLKLPDEFLFARDYDAIGWYSHLERNGIDPWKFLDNQYLTVLKTHSSFDGYDVALKAGSPDKAIDSWGPSYIRDEALGAEWAMVGKGLPTYVKTKISEGALASGDTLTETILPMQAWAIKLDIQSEVFVVVGASARGMIRFSDGSSHTLQSILGQPFCTKPGGCDCPDGSAGADFNFQTAPSGVAQIGFTGHTDGLDVDLVGFSLPDTCEKEPGDLQVPEPCYCGGYGNDQWPALADRRNNLRG